MFKLNEAPNIVLSALSVHKTKRSCGAFWSIACCLPTLGMSIGCGGGDNNWMGCYPKDITYASKGGLNALIDALKLIRSPTKNKEDISSENQRLLKSPQMKQNIIEWQVYQTIRVLQQAIKENVIKGSYKKILDDVYEELLSRAAQEEKFSMLIKKRPIDTGVDVYVPIYGVYSK